MPKRVSFHHQFVISLSLLFVSEEVFKNVSPFSCTFVPCMYKKSFNLCSIIVWNDCLQKEFFNSSMKAGCSFSGHVMMLWGQKKFIKVKLFVSETPHLVAKKSCTEKYFEVISGNTAVKMPFRVQLIAWNGSITKSSLLLMKIGQRSRSPSSVWYKRMTKNALHVK